MDQYFPSVMLLYITLVSLFHISSTQVPFPPPTKLRASNVLGQIILNWTQPVQVTHEVTSYRIHLRNNRENILVDTNNTNTFFVVRNVLFGLQYTFFVKSEYNNGEFSDWSNIAQITVNDVPGRSTDVDPRITTTTPLNKTLLITHTAISPTDRTEVSSLTVMIDTSDSLGISDKLKIGLIVVFSLMLVALCICIITVILRTKQKKDTDQKDLMIADDQNRSYEKLNRDHNIRVQSSHIYDIPRSDIDSYVEVV